MLEKEDMNIVKLHDYCSKIGLNHEFYEYLDGFKIKFANGDDCVQHKYSYGNSENCIEFACNFSSRISYKATSLQNAKRFVHKYKDKLLGISEKRKDQQISFFIEKNKSK